MNNDQLLVLGILLGTMALFLWGRWRHDMVALAALLACVVTGLVPQGHAFAGFGHPAVITVACVLVLSRGLQTSGAVDILARAVLPTEAGPVPSLAALIGLGALLSGVMNNVGAMVLLMPVAMQLARRLDIAPGQALMPLAFGTILGGMTTMIGTPPNLIVAGFREELGVGGFAMFDFTPVGLTVAAAGVVFVVLVGWRLVPVRKETGVEGFDSGAYITEARIPRESATNGMAVRDVEASIADIDAQILGLVRNDVRITAPNLRRVLRAGDILVIEAEAEALSAVLSRLGLELEEAAGSPGGQPAANDDAEQTSERGGHDGEGHAADEDLAGNGDHGAAVNTAITASEVVLMELAVMPTSSLAGRSASDLLLRTRYGLNLLAPPASSRATCC